MGESSAKRVNRSRYIILGMLARGPSSGYDIMKSIRTSTAFFWSESFGQLYPNLERLKEEGLVKSKKDTKSPRGKSLYQITAKGLEELKAWLVTPYQPAIERNELLLKVFFSGIVSPAAALRHFAQAREEAQQYLRTLSEIEASLKVILPEKTERIFYEATLDLGIRIARAQVAWCDEMEIETRRTFAAEGVGSGRRK